MSDFENVLLSAPWWAVASWVALYVTDYALTIRGARLYRQGANEHIVFEGSYELTPQFQKDIDRLRTFSPRFLLYLVLSAAMLVAIWWVVRQQPGNGWLYLFYYGALVFPQFVVLARHARNIALFRRLRTHQGVEGRVSYAKWLTLEQSSVELAFMALLLLAAAAVAGSASLCGGAFALAVLALKHRRLSRKQRPAPPA